MYRKSIIGIGVLCVIYPFHTQSMVIYNGLKSFFGRVKEVPANAVRSVATSASDAALRPLVGQLNSVVENLGSTGGNLLHQAQQGACSVINHTGDVVPLMMIKTALGVGGVAVSGAVVAVLAKQYIKKRFNDFSIVQKLGMGSGSLDLQAVMANMVINDDHFPILVRDFNASGKLPLLLLSGPQGVGKRFFIEQYAPASGLHYVALNAVEMRVRYAQNAGVFIDKLKMIIDQAQRSNNKTLLVIYNVDLLWKDQLMAKTFEDYIIRPISNARHAIMFIGTTDESLGVLDERFKNCFTEHYEFKIASWNKRLDALIQFHIDKNEKLGTLLSVSDVKEKLNITVSPLKVVNIIEQEYEKRKLALSRLDSTCHTIDERLRLIVAQQLNNKKELYNNVPLIDGSVIS